MAVAVAERLRRPLVTLADGLAIDDDVARRTTRRRSRWRRTRAAVAPSIGRHSLRRPRRPAGVEGHRALERGGAHVGGDLHRAADPRGVDRRLRRLLHDPRRRGPRAPASDGTRGPHGWPAARPGSPDDGGADVGDRLAGAARPVPATGTPSGRPNIASASTQQPIGPVGDRERGGIRRVGVDHAAHVRAVLVHGGVHRDDGPLDRRAATPSRSCPSSPTRTMPSGPSPRNDGAEVKYISSASGYPDAHVAVAVRGDGAAGDDAGRRIQHLVDESLVHGVPLSVSVGWRVGHHATAPAGTAGRDPLLRDLRPRVARPHRRT